MKNTLFAILLMAGFSACSLNAEEAVLTPAPLPEATWQKLPRWRGFNLLNRFSIDWSNRLFTEDDFRLISEQGFNFVRLPLDYRTYVKDGDWLKFNEEVLGNIDQAVEWGKKHGIHVNVNLHRAPGYCINAPKEAKDLWTDPEAQKVCAKHWALFAKRYKGRPNREVSFNLFNEPIGVDNANYAKVVAVMCRAIRKEDPDRLILCDGNEAGMKPVPELIPLKVAQCTRGYQPFGITHYKVPWVAGSSEMAAPLWPAVKIVKFLYGEMKPEYQAPWTLEGKFLKKSTLRIHVDTVSQEAELRVKADGKVILSKDLKCAGGTGEWKEAVWKEEWKIFQNVYDKNYSAVIPAGTRKVEVSVAKGDWMTFTELEIRPEGGAPVTYKPTVLDWGVKPGPLYLGSDGLPDPGRNLDAVDRVWLQKQFIDPWKALEAQGVGVMVGEWGVYNKTPHDVTLRFEEDCLKNWQEAGWGWALWNYTGDFGPLDSKRNDVTYEEWQGHQLDRKMLEILQRY